MTEIKLPGLKKRNVKPWVERTNPLPSTGVPVVIVKLKITKDFPAGC